MAKITTANAGPDKWQRQQEAPGDKKYTDSIYNRIGVIHHNKGEYKEAIENYEEAHKLKVKEVYCYNIGLAYDFWAKLKVNEEKLKLHNNSIRYYSDAMEFSKMYPKDVYLNRIGIQHFQIGDLLERKETAFRKARKFFQQ